MEKEIAEKYPLLKDFDFKLEITGKPGEGTLLIPKRNIYLSKGYGFGELALIPYLQEYFNENLELPYNELKNNLDIENESILSSEFSFDGEPSFLERVLRKLRLHEILNHKKVRGAEICFCDEDTLSKGSNYDIARVYNMSSYENTKDLRTPFRNFF